MKKLSEVTKLTGVSRRALQGYDKLNLVSPSAKTEAGYWLYDDSAIKKILFIQMFKEVGYERKKIMDIMNNPQFDLDEELKIMIEMLEEKKARIDGMINLAKQWQVVAKLPTPTLKAMEKMNISKMYQNTNYMESLKSYIDESANFTDEEVLEIEKYSPFFYHLFAIASLKNYDSRTKLVQNCVHEFYLFFIEMIEEEDKLPEEDRYSVEVVDAFIEGITDNIFENKEFVDEITKQCGDGAVEFIIKSLKIFKELVLRNYWK